MLTTEENSFFGGFKGFQYQPSGTAEAVFMRLAKFKGWQTSSPIFRLMWFEVVGYEFSDHHDNAVGNSGQKETEQGSKHASKDDANNKIAQNQTSLTQNGTKTNSAIKPKDEDLSATLVKLNINAKSFTPERKAPLTASTSDAGVPVTWFDKRLNFSINPVAPLREEFDRLAKINNWGEKKYRANWAKCSAAEFERFSGGKGDKLEAWQQMCGDLGITPIPKSITQCKKALSGIHVNIYDYINCKRAGKNIEPVFTNFHKFRARTLPMRFPKAAAKENALLKTLLKVVGT